MCKWRVLVNLSALEEVVRNPQATWKKKIFLPQRATVRHFVYIHFVPESCEECACITQQCHKNVYPLRQRAHSVHL